MPVPEMREHILNEIRRLTAANGGKAPGSRLFHAQTDITEAAWRGVYWARWSDAILEAGAEPNSKVERIDDDVLLEQLAAVVMHYRKPPTAMEIRLFARTHGGAPNIRTLDKRFGGLTPTFQRLHDWAGKTGRADIASIVEVRARTDEQQPVPTKEGFVYLLKSGAHHKIGRSDEIERRIKQITVAMPESTEMVHAIRTDDPAGIEAYWHRRFADRRANGEWFKLTTADIAAFKRRKFQ